MVGGIDNLLYPILVGKRLKIHTVLAFISLVGGVMLFGPSGLVLGPVIFTVTQQLLQIWHRHNVYTRSSQSAYSLVRFNKNQAVCSNAQNGCLTK